MRKWLLFLTLIVLFVPAMGQTIYAGGAVSSGAAESVFMNSGAPMTYAARTDGCVNLSVTASLCSASATTGETGAVMLFQGGDSDPLPFNRLDNATAPAVMNTSFTDPDFGTYEVFATDQTTNPNNTTAVLDFGSDGSHDAFGPGTANDVMMTFQSDGGKTFIDHVVESRLLAQACSPANPCVIPSGLIQNTTCTETDSNYGSGNNCTNAQFGGPIAFSRNPADPPNTFFDLDLPKIWKTTVTAGYTNGIPNGTDTLTRTLWVDFSADGDSLTTAPCSLMPTDYNYRWNGTFSTSNTGAVTIATAGGGSYQTIWQQMGLSSNPGATAVTTDVFIQPVNNISGIQYYMFQVTTPGTTSGTEPNWAASCPAQGNTCTDGTAVWTNIGKVNGQAPGFDLLHFDPARGCSRINTRLAKMYRGHNEGASWPSSGTADASGALYTDDMVTVYRMGQTSGVVPFTDLFTIHDAAQPMAAGYGNLSATGGDSINKNWGTSSSSNAGGSYWTISTTPNGSCFGVNLHTLFPTGQRPRRIRCG